MEVRASSAKQKEMTGFIKIIKKRKEKEKTERPPERHVLLRIGHEKGEARD